MSYDSELSYDAGTLEVSVTFTNPASMTGEAFKTLVEHALGEAVAQDLSGEILLLPNHDSTGVILGNG